MIRRLLLFSTIILIMNGGVTATAEVDGGYLRVDKNTLLYRVQTPQEEADIFFTIPYSYYVKVLSDADCIVDKGIRLSNDYYYVEYQGVRGFVRKAEFAAPSSISSVTTPYYSQQLALSRSTELSLIIGNSTVTYSLTPNSAIRYVGFYKNETATLYYVSAQIGTETVYGYVDSSATSDVLIAESIPSHPSTSVPVVVPTEPIGDDSVEPETQDSDLLNTIIAIGMMIPTILLLSLIFKTKNRYQN